DQEYVEDCHICCRPLVLTVDLTDPEAPSVSVTPEND
ncbi:MAG TPA: CPXCG motif-containing cysteine-rich protein, partial [Alcanivorax sp.]|nr:CPXCG motif-containing cysteine-rich protein [Alcanivorax sp.]HCQ37102.1 CPXCG motif-containing cysteine-rich protein [Alcanivorax sp.]